MSIVFVLLMQVVATEAAPAAAPGPAAEQSQATSADGGGASQTEAERRQEIRCRNRPVTGERLRSRLCERVDDDHAQGVAAGVRHLQGNGASIDPQRPH